MNFVRNFLIESDKKRFRFIIRRIYAVNIVVSITLVNKSFISFIL